MASKHEDRVYTQEELIKKTTSQFLISFIAYFASILSLCYYLYISYSCKTLSAIKSVNSLFPLSYFCQNAQETKSVACKHLSSNGFTMLTVNFVPCSLVTTLSEKRILPLLIICPIVGRVVCPRKSTPKSGRMSCPSPSSAAGRYHGFGFVLRVADGVVRKQRCAPESHFFLTPSQQIYC